MEVTTAAVIQQIQAMEMTVGDSTPGGDTSTVLSGQFFDAPTNGLYYKTSSGESGYTREIGGKQGSFEYKAGDTVEFRLGGEEGLLFGQVAAQPYVMPQDIASQEAAVNITRLLLSINSTANNDELITISDDFQRVGPTELEKLVAIDLEDIETDRSNIEDLLEDIDSNISDGTLTLTTSQVAEEHLSKSSEEVAKEKGDSEQLSLVGKLMREYHIPVSAGSDRCSVDLTGDDSGSEAPRKDPWRNERSVR